MSVCLCVCRGVLAFGFTYTSAEAKDYPASSGVRCGQHVESPSRCCFLDRYYRYKWIAIQIPHNTELAPIPFSGRKFLPKRDSKQRLFHCTNSAVRLASFPIVQIRSSTPSAFSHFTNSKQYALNHIIPSCKSVAKV